MLETTVFHRKVDGHIHATPSYSRHTAWIIHGVSSSRMAQSSCSFRVRAGAALGLTRRLGVGVRDSVDQLLDDLAA